MKKTTEKPSLRISLAQINCAVGDLAGNVARILEYAEWAGRQEADVVVFPELSLTGYPPEDLVMRRHFQDDTRRALTELAKKMPAGPPALVGFTETAGTDLHNAAAVLFGGKIRAVYRKQRLPNYGVFDEKRYFAPGKELIFLKIRGVCAGITLCEDVWADDGPAPALAKQGAQVILNLSASPYHAGKQSLRRRTIGEVVKKCGRPLVYCNMVGGQDELVFDGGSMAMDAHGRIVADAPQFEECLLTADIPVPPATRFPKNIVPLSPAPAGTKIPIEPPPSAAPLSELDEIYSALVLGTRDYVKKNGFKKAVLGLSGGIDSSLVACVAVDALGKENVIGVTMPSRFNSPETRSDAEILSRNLGIGFHSVPIETVTEEFLKVLRPVFGDRPRDLAEENLQARVRGTLLMALSNKFGWMVLTTGNKSEVSVGYSTLYGDTAGGFAVIKDIPKTLVYRLARRRNEKAGRQLIPQSVFDRPPTAELRPNQTDQDSLPPYELLDNIIRLYVEEDKGLGEIVKSGVGSEIAAKVLRLVDASEYKRRQAPPGVKITPKAFGRDRRMPITNRYRPGQPN